MQLRYANALACAWIALTCAGCHSLSKVRATQVIHCEQQSAALGLWFLAPGYPMSGGDTPFGEAVSAVLLYPLDVVASTVIAVRAPFDPNMDIAWGPVGAIAGIALPWVTLIPYTYSPIVRPPVEVHLDQSAFANLVTRIRNGDGVAAYHEFVPKTDWVLAREEVLSVVLIEE